MAVNLDMIIEAGAPDAPFGIEVALCRQRTQSRSIDLLEQLPPGAADAAQHPALVEIGEQFDDHGIDLGQAVKDTMAKAAQKPALDNAHRRGRRGLVGSTELP